MGYRVDREDPEMMKVKGTFLVPTVGGIDVRIEAHKNDPLTPEQRKRRDAFLQGIQESIQTARSLGVKIAAGFDPAGVDSHGRNATELAAMK